MWAGRLHQLPGLCEDRLQHLGGDGGRLQFSEASPPSQAGGPGDIRTGFRGFNLTDLKIPSWLSNHSVAAGRDASRTRSVQETRGASSH